MSLLVLVWGIDLGNLSDVIMRGHWNVAHYHKIL